MKDYKHYREPRRRQAKSEPLPRRAPDQSSMRSCLDRRGLSYELAVGNGWYLSLEANDNQPRIVIPCTNSAGRAYWQARFIHETPNAKRYQSPKYAAEDSIVVVWPDKPATRAAVVEGPMDALAAAMCGYIGVGIMGNRPSNAVMRNIVAVLPTQDFIVVPDLDSAEAGGFIAGKLALAGRRVTVKLPVGAKDLSRMAQVDRERLLND